MEYLDNDIKYVGGVGEARARLLDKELGIRTLGDMLSHYPFRYIDRTKVYRIAEITEGAPPLPAVPRPHNGGGLCRYGA